ncbi:hypothetical protein Taro_001824 [Colocasia esculenta]|uniref:Uncharacterized protein n=1 Tax=Colocasia esculenta TaxID=4460 RepID=A0A843TLS3_COLES|nr:hypothetical protein [Colocasia esculenta]
MAAERAQLRDMQQTIQQLTQALLQAAGANTNNNNNRGAGTIIYYKGSVDTPMMVSTQCSKP